MPCTTARSFDLRFKLNRLFAAQQSRVDLLGLKPDRMHPHHLNTGRWEILIFLRVQQPISYGFKLGLGAGQQQWVDLGEAFFGWLARDADHSVDEELTAANR